MVNDYNAAIYFAQQNHSLDIMRGQGMPDILVKMAKEAGENCLKPVELNIPSKLEALAAGAGINLKDFGITIASSEISTACNTTTVAQNTPSQGRW